MGKLLQDQMLGENAPSDIAEYLMDIGDLDAVKELQGGAGGQSLFSTSRPFLGTESRVALIGPKRNGRCKLLTTAKPDEKLKNKRVKIVLENMFVRNYPGGGKHQILLEFKTKNQTRDQAEELCFAVKGEATDNSLLNLQNLPLFIGLQLGSNGITLDYKAVAVSSEGDDALLAALSSAPFKLGITLIGQIQPAMAPFVSLADGAVKFIAEQRKNSIAHKLNLGLDFSGEGALPGLNYGMYAIVQEHRGGSSLDISKCEYDTAASRIVCDGEAIDRNYLIIAIREFASEQDTQ